MAGSAALTNQSHSAVRLGWLDALRGMAALAVVFDHLSYHVLKGVRLFVYGWFDPGSYGVFVFFLISGYIVPASLERTGSVRTFWVSRLFRLYPMYLLVIAGSVLLWRLNIIALPGSGDLLTTALTWLLMLPDLMAGPNVPNVVWSLSFEMVFYLLLTALFVCRIHRRSGRYSLGFAVAAVVLGGLLPRVWLSGHLATPRLAALAADLLIGAGLGLAVALRGTPRLLGTALAGGTGLVLLALNGAYASGWEALTILALMFTGTMLYRVDRGEYPRAKAITFTATVLGLAITAALLHDGASATSAASLRWISSLALAGVTFGAGLAFRDARVPAALTWLGVISYSVYLLHPLLISIYHRLPPARQDNMPFAVQVLVAMAFFAVLIALSSLTYLFAERPMQRLGRRLSRHLDVFLGPDHTPGGPGLAEKRQEVDPARAASCSPERTPVHGMSGIASSHGVTAQQPPGEAH
jgi:peptidoglycan/LPS O-acetylase OafA/YrhL